MYCHRVLRQCVLVVCAHSRQHIFADRAARLRITTHTMIRIYIHNYLLSKLLHSLVLLPIGFDGCTKLERVRAPASVQRAKIQKIE
jgi:hypothetical protein